MPLRLDQASIGTSNRLCAHEVMPEFERDPGVSLRTILYSASGNAPRRDWGGAAEGAVGKNIN